MESINEKILQDYQLLVSRLDVIRADQVDQTRSYARLHKAFIDLLDVYQQELDTKGHIAYDRQDVNYHWLEKAGILD